ncbi:lysophospholipase L1-like esterase [Singulisphaera acidiphila DSM 18658]|uniref:Lysophospholipase L1-like esterase n=2 Tax=Singulisphaera acidiphila TaxID=466153 RepID=L0DME4_SINAD|nr:lysophospholipase L1-like esterase [Singulisphaera acidiphila DSM 18658]
MTPSHSMTIGDHRREPMKSQRGWVAALVFGAGLLAFIPGARGEESPFEGVRRVLFLGDSITYSGQYIEYVETALRARNPSLHCEFLNLGLPSETVSGLTEPGHAGGQFSRPDLHERLERILEQSKPEWIVICYGMNDGIYSPLDDARFKKFQDGIHFVRARAQAKGAKVLHLTPPVFDPLPIMAHTLPAGLEEYRQPYQGYNEVLDRYSEWLMGQKAQGWDVLDIHGPLNQYLAKQRSTDPKFLLAGDGVHMNSTGHWIMARELLAHWKVPAADLAAPSGEEALAAMPQGTALLKLVQKRQRLLKDAWLTATGHTRPGMKQGVSLEQAERQAADIEAEIVGLVTPKP